MVKQMCTFPSILLFPGGGLCGRGFKASRFELLVPLLCGSGSNPMRGSCQLLTEGYGSHQEQFVSPAVENDLIL